MGLSRRPLRVFTLLSAAAGAALTGCGTDLPQTPFDPQGPVASMQLEVLSLSLWFAIGIGTFVAVALLYVVLKFRHRGGDEAVPKQIHGNTKLEVVWTLIPALILVYIGVPTVKTAFSTAASPTDDALRIKVTGNQWWFGFEYPDHGIETANEMYIPVGQPVKLELTSNDVIHSFWVPKLAGKMDLMPGDRNEMWLQADRADVYYGQCGEFCGASHAKMRFRVVAVSPEEFDQWVAERQAGAKEPTDPQAVLGKSLFEGEGGRAACWTCHTIDGSAKSQGKVGPNLSNIGARTTIGAGILENTEENLKAWIRDSSAIKPGSKMQAHPLLTEEELSAIIRYLQSLD